MEEQCQQTYGDDRAYDKPWICQYVGPVLIEQCAPVRIRNIRSQSNKRQPCILQHNGTGVVAKIYKQLPHDVRKDMQKQNCRFFQSDADFRADEIFFFHSGCQSFRQIDVLTHIPYAEDNAGHRRRKPKQSRKNQRHDQ